MSESLYLSQEQARILGVLIEKAITSPDHYPLTPVALLGGCNQKHSRHPVMAISQEQLDEALTELLDRSFVEQLDNPIRYRHNLQNCWGVNKAELCLLSLLLLRGTLSSNDLLHRSEHLFTFSGISQVDKTLQAMSEVEENPLVLKVQPSATGESGWMHTLCLTPGFPRAQPDLMEQLELHEVQQNTNQKMVELEQRVKELEDIVAMLSTPDDGKPSTD